MARSSDGRKLLAQLITTTTGFEKDEENFAICRNYVNSNLRFHRYLDVDSHKVNQKLNGLYEKFAVHSKTGEGKFLETKVSQFLCQCDFERKDAEKTETHYAILSFLLDMSNRPTSQNYVPLMDKDDSQLADEDFDWHTYLTEDLESLQSQFSDSSTDSEEEEVEIRHVVDQDTNEVSQELTSNLVSEQVKVTTSSLRDRLVTNYWCGEQDVRLHMTTDLVHNWRSYLTRMGSFETAMQDTYMTEYQMVREVLWMVSGATSLFLFTYDSATNRYQVRSGVSLIHATKSSVESKLRLLLEFASMLSTLRTFSRDYLAYKYASAICTTYQAFSAALQGVILDIDQFTTDVIQRIQRDEQTSTLMAVGRMYDKYDQLIVTLHDVYDSSIRPTLSASRPSMSSAASLLLTRCNSALNEVGLYSQHQYVVATMLKVFLRTLQPYLDIVDEWLSHGSLNDPYLEFVIRKRRVECLDETFWNTALEMTIAEGVDSAEGANGSFLFTQSVPHILEGTLDRIAVTGKSMEMLSGLGKLNLALSDHERDLYCVYLEALCSSIRSYNSESGVLDVTENTSLPKFRVQTPDCKAEINQPVSQLLAANFQALESNQDHKPPADIHQCLESLDFPSAMNLPDVMSKCLSKLTSERYSHVSEALLKVLSDDCGLQHNLNLIRKIYLMDAGDMMYDFTWELFDKIKHKESWKDSLSLNLTLHECLQKQLPQDTYRFNITLEEVRKSEFLPIHAFESLKLHFEVDWPIGVIYDSEMASCYARIFQFLLQLKLSKFCLDNLKFDELTERHDLQPADNHGKRDDHVTSNDDDEIDVLTQSVYLHRCRLLHVINGLHDYIMTNIIQSAKVQFDTEMQKVGDLEGVMQAHRSFVNTIYDRCFLHENTMVIRDCILHILNFPLVFQQMWDEGVHTLRKERFTELVSEFDRCLQVLLSFITPLNKTGCLPHLEHLGMNLRMA